MLILEFAITLLAAMFFMSVFANFVGIELGKIHPNGAMAKFLLWVILSLGGVLVICVSIVMITRPAAAL